MREDVLNVGVSVSVSPELAGFEPPDGGVRTWPRARALGSEHPWQWPQSLPRASALGYARPPLRGYKNCRLTGFEPPDGGVRT